MAYKICTIIEKYLICFDVMLAAFARGARRRRAGFAALYAICTRKEDVQDDKDKPG
jgi:hypothetical protein